MLKLLVAIALAIVSVECAAACTPVACAQPPCHHHQQAPACKHELVPATIVPSVVIGACLSSQAVDAPLVLGNLASFYTPTIENPSPPGPPAPLLRVLRI
jgi:hypothetical protein